MVWVNAGQTLTYCVSIEKDIYYLKAGVSGLTMNTRGSVKWIFPDGSIYPQTSSQGSTDIVSMNGAGLIVLRAKKYPWGNPNIAFDYIPRGVHRLIVEVPAGYAYQGYFKLFIDAY